MRDKYAYFKENLDELRTALFQEPRGFENMLGAFVVEPTSEMADYGVIYAGATQYFEMCGDSTFSVAKMLIETGMVAPIEPATKIRLDTYGGIVEVEVQVKDGTVGSIAYRSVPAFFLKTVDLQVPSLSKVTTDIAFGGLWYAFVEASQVGVEIAPPNMKKLLAVGMELLSEVNRQAEVKHPLDPELSEVALITFYERNPEEGVDYKIANVYGDNATCRSPAGTMTAARAAISYSKGELAKGGQMVLRNGWIKSEHRVRVIDETMVGEFPAIIPELTATAYITGMYQAILEYGDVHRKGFLI
jgi:proline racemase